MFQVSQWNFLYSILSNPDDILFYINLSMFLCWFFTPHIYSATKNHDALFCVTWCSWSTFIPPYLSHLFLMSHPYFTPLNHTRHWKNNKSFLLGFLTVYYRRDLYDIVYKFFLLVSDCWCCMIMYGGLRNLGEGEHHNS